VPVPRLPLPGPVAHGGPDYAELARLGLPVDQLVDFSVNVNPLGTSPRAIRALGAVEPSRYPDPEALRLRSALAAHLDVRLDDIAVGNGSVELIWLLAQVYLAAGDQAVVVGPTFGEYAAATGRQGADVLELRASEADLFRPRVADIARQIEDAGPRVVFHCNPNNPTGRALNHDDLSVLLRASRDALVVVDEAYLDFADGVDSALSLRPNPRLVLLRSLTKAYGLAGARLGYMVADRRVVDAVTRARPPWTVNAFAQAAGLAALGDEEHVAKGRLLARRARAMVVDRLGRLGLRCVPSQTGFWMVEVGDAAELRSQLLQRGILVRDCSSFGLPRYIRLAARPMPDCERLLSAVEALVESGRLS
jgi:histidinol-phosphate aminotransferase